MQKRLLSRLLPIVALVLALAMSLAGCAKPQSWALNDISGHLPDLDFTLTGADGKPLHGSDFRGKIVLLYFGFTHCPDVCPLTLTHLHQVMGRLGPASDDVRILFVSVDPRRDTPEVLSQYVHAFDKHAVGATGSARDLRAMAKRYRVAFDLKKPDAYGNYEVSHSSAVFIFDRNGKARLLTISADDTDGLVRDITQLLQAS